MSYSVAESVPGWGGGSQRERLQSRKDCVSDAGTAVREPWWAAVEGRLLRTDGRRFSSSSSSSICWSWFVCLDSECFSVCLMFIFPFYFNWYAVFLLHQNTETVLNKNKQGNKKPNREIVGHSWNKISIIVPCNQSPTWLLLSIMEAVFFFLFFVF